VGVVSLGISKLTLFVFLLSKLLPSRSLFVV
jgi:hypothetical protein